MSKIKHRDVNAELYGRSLLSVQAQLMLLRDKVNEDARLSARLDPTQSDECRLLSLDIGRKLRTINDWIHDIRHEYGVELRPLVGDPSPSPEHPATVEGEVIDAAQ